MSSPSLISWGVWANTGALSLRKREAFILNVLADMLNSPVWI